MEPPLLSLPFQNQGVDKKETYLGRPCTKGHDGRRRIKTKECVECYEARHLRWQTQLADLAARRAAGELNSQQRRNAFRKQQTAERRQRLASTPRHCPRCNKDKFEIDFLVRPNTKHPEWCVKCRTSHAKHQRSRETGRYAQLMARREVAKKRQKPRWAKNRPMDAIYAYARFLRDNGIDCHVDHIVPLRGETASGLHAADNLRVLMARTNVAKSNDLPANVLSIPSEWQNPVFQSWAKAQWT